jgi:hypothetical protein
VLGRRADVLTVSDDAGRTWSVALRRAAPTDAALEPPTLRLFGRSLRWAFDSRTLLRSDDGGRSWRASASP